MGARASGLLVHPTSLPGPFGIGDIGPEAVRFLDWAAEAGQRLWQFLPLGPTDAHHSPYATRSSWAGNAMLLSPAGLVGAGWLAPRELAGIGGGSSCGGTIDFDRVVPWKRALLHRAWTGFTRLGSARDRERYEAFVEHEQQRSWLEDWALYAAWIEHRAGPAPPPRSPSANSARGELAEAIAEQRWLQFVFFEQWAALRREAASRGIALLGDVPFYVAGDGADVWSRPELFRLDATGRPTHVAGVPPDRFSAEGQLWGNPLYRWEALEAEGFAWWIDRVRAGLRTADLLRLDHFRGFAGYWEVEASASTAVGGRWVPGPGRPLFDACARTLGGLPFVAEDLGAITPDVHALRAELGLPGTRVLQFAFDGGDRATHSPRNPASDVVFYTGTHDNDTLRGWFDRLPGPERAQVLGELRADERTVVRRAIETLYECAAERVVIPLQDVLELGSAARMNRPGSVHGNWAWRAESGSLTLQRAARLRRLAEATARL